MLQTNRNIHEIIFCFDFCSDSSFAHNLARLLEPFDSRLSEALKMEQDALMVTEKICIRKQGCPVTICRLGKYATVYWLPIRSDLSMEHLPTLLAKCGAPGQALILPAEIDDSASCFVSLRLSSFGFC